MKLAGRAKAAFLAKMAAGRRRAGRQNPTPTKRVKSRPARRRKAARGKRSTLPVREVTQTVTIKRRRNPDLLTLSNPSRADLARARAAYVRFHGVNPKEVRRGRGRGVFIVLGELREVVYQPRRGQRRGPAFFHKFGRGAKLAASVDGKRLILVPRKGKPHRVDWERGIIG